jgi:hypothetical protein
MIILCPFRKGMLQEYLKKRTNDNINCMRKKKFEFGVRGFIIGLFIGVLAGFGALTQINKSQRGMMLPIAVPGFAVFFAISGYKKGSAMGKSAYINEQLGIDEPLSHGFFKEGRYWYGITKWQDKRDGTEHKIITGRSNHKNLISMLDDRLIMIHDCKSAAAKTVPKYHLMARSHIWGILKTNFSEDPVNAESIIPTIIAKAADFSTSE